MKRILFSVALSTLLATAALATPGNNGGGNGGCGVGQQTNGCGPVNNYSPNLHGEQYQAQGQIQGQAQGQGQSQRSYNRNDNRNTNLNANVNQNRNSNRNTATSRSTSHSTSAATANNRNTVAVRNGGNSQSMSYNEARDRLQAPNVYGNFAGGATSPCERNTSGLGGSGPGFGGLFQVPVSSETCWGERQATFLMQSGCQNAALAVLAGDPVRVALANNPCGGQRARAVRAKY